jgi:hypothetical protein
LGGTSVRFPAFHSRAAVTPQPRLSQGPLRGTLLSDIAELSPETPCFEHYFRFVGNNLRFGDFSASATEISITDRSPIANMTLASAKPAPHRSLSVSTLSARSVQNVAASRCQHPSQIIAQVHGFMVSQSQCCRLACHQQRTPHSFASLRQALQPPKLRTPVQTCDR